jgi:predicted glycosyltransferase involved in capsule biosynthesis
MNYNSDKLIEILKDRKIDYKRLLSHKENFFGKEKVDISIVIGIQGREKHLKKCFDYLNYAKDHCGLKIGVIVVQQGNEPTCRLHSIEKGASYIFLPLEDLNTNGLYSPALGYNVGFLANPNANMFMFHGCDILFPHDFFKIFEAEYYNRDFKWLQNYFGKSLYYLNKDQTKKVFDLNGLFNLYNLPNVEKGSPGAPGGSITVRKEAFMEVGGFDPELFYGWAPEDSFFWTKLLCMVKKIDTMRACHQFESEINSCYPNNPPLRLYHLFHESTGNSKWGEMTEMHDAFWNLLHEEKLKYIEVKRHEFEQTTNTLNSVRK